MTKIIIQTRVYKLHPNQVMRQVLDEACDYRRYCWNQALSLWNDLYFARQIMFDEDLKSELRKPPEDRQLTDNQKQLLESNPAPSEYLVRNLLVENKQDWQYQYSAHLLQLAVNDLAKAFDHFFDKSQKDWGKPKFKSKRSFRQGFKSNQSRIIDNVLYLERPQKSKVSKSDWTGFKLDHVLSDKFGTISYFKERGRYYVSIPFKVDDKKPLPKTGKATGIDVNVGHFDYLDGQVKTLPKRLVKRYEKVRHYQRQLSKKKRNSNNYLKTKAKLQIEYRKIADCQNDICHKFTTFLVKHYDAIVIEDLNVKAMAMGIASKGLHRSIFGKFRQMLDYKCKWHGRQLIIADKFYPSTQRCHACGYVKKGDEKVTLYGNRKHNTKHNEYVCYNPNCINYQKTISRDTNAMLSLTALASHPELNKKF